MIGGEGGFRKFGKKKYTLLTVFETKPEAEKFATRWRCSGPTYLVRITKERNGMYYIWSRKNDIMTRCERGYMAFYIFRFDYPYTPSWHVIEAETKLKAAEKAVKDTRIPETKVKFWKRKGSLPKNLYGGKMLPKGWTP